MKRLILLSTLLLALNASATSQLEPLMGFLRDANGISFQVFSGGCTSKEDFSVKEKTADGIAALALYRLKPDYCSARYPYGVIITFTYQELGIGPGERFSVLNHLSY